METKLEAFRRYVFVANTLTLLESVKNEGSCYGEGWELFKLSVKIKAIERSSLLKHEATKQEALLRNKEAQAGGDGRRGRRGWEVRSACLIDSITTSEARRWSSFVTHFLVP